ncbi:hypothetical protein [Pseudobacteroides cellulosolvens]|uniref:Uncharacterized protein n=1 Tax=Pseudobacteroides cellulosolvens ATCC 35603 = DSM 2933 TaxID=398512 RepID=A0A0L6JNT5_9FIRM|nr:hypothetical protein [Pseudobacteroides cellulosolvens]KNY27501.1 hypothetical protein Bccel_2772 [Pseudobacteroides cellulosolvens ATCC 35603 = DSM 2933]
MSILRRRLIVQLIYIYSFLNNASRMVSDISKKFKSVDLEIAQLISEETEYFRQIIRDTNVKGSYVGKLTSCAYKDVKLMNKVTGTSMIPVTYVPKNPDSANLVMRDSNQNPKNISFDWSELGLNPFDPKGSKSNTINTFLDTLINALLCFNVSYNSKKYPFNKCAVSVIKHVIDDIEYILITGKDSAIRQIGIPIPPNAKYGMKAAADIPIEVLKKINSSQILRETLKRFRKITSAKDDFRVKIVLKELQDDLLKQLPRFGEEELELTEAIKKSFYKVSKNAGEEVRKLINKRFFTEMADELKTIFKSGFKRKMLVNICKSSKLLVALGIAIDILFDASEHKGQWDLVVADVVVDIALGLASVAISTYVTGFLVGMASEVAICAAIGSCVPIIGTIAEAFVGIAIGIVFSFVTEAIKIDGVSLKKWLKERVVVKLIQVAADLGKVVNDLTVDITNNISREITIVGDKVSKVISSGIKWLLDSNTCKKESITSKPSESEYNKQLQMLQPLKYSHFQMATSITFGKNFNFKDLP